MPRHAAGPHRLRRNRDDDELPAVEARPRQGGLCASWEPRPGRGMPRYVGCILELIGVRAAYGARSRYSAAAMSDGLRKAVVALLGANGAGKTTLLGM